MWEQKDLWIKMHEATEGYDVLAFRTGPSHHAFIHNEGVTHKCMTYLQNSSDKIDPKSGVWRLWYNPLNVERASVR